MVVVFCMKVNFMADLRRKYVCRSAVALVKTHSFGVTFLFSGGIGKLSSAGYDKKVPEYTELLRKIQPSGESIGAGCMCGSPRY